MQTIERQDSGCKHWEGEHSGETTMSCDTESRALVEETTRTGTMNTLHRSTQHAVFDIVLTSTRTTSFLQTNPKHHTPQRTSINNEASTVIRNANLHDQLPRRLHVLIVLHQNKTNIKWNLARKIGNITWKAKRVRHEYKSPHKHQLSNCISNNPMDFRLTY